MIYTYIVVLYFSFLSIFSKAVSSLFSTGWPQGLEVTVEHPSPI
jgi:hypothetical protein